MADPPVRLHHWLYGVTPGEGYGIKGSSVGLNIALFEAPLRGFYTPIRGEAVQSADGVNLRMIHPGASGEDILLSRLGRGPPDELGRPTFQNHIAIIPGELLTDGRLSLAGVDGALGAFDAANPGALGELGPLEVPAVAAGYRLGAGLRQHLTRAAVETIATRLLVVDDARTLLLCRDTAPAVRNDILFRLVELLIFVAAMPAVTAMSDAPTASSLNTFNLVIAPRGVRADNSWAIVEASTITPPMKRAPGQESAYAAIEASFAADAATFG